MLRNLFLRNAAAAIAVAGVLAVTQLASPGLVTSSPAIAVRSYPARVATNTHLWLDHSQVRPGQSNTAHVRVSSDVQTPQGTVTFRVGQRAPRTVALVQGRASYAMPRNLKAGRTYRVTARYNGNEIYKPSSDSTSVTVSKSRNQVLGVQAERGNTNGGGSAGNGDKSSGNGSANRAPATQNAARAGAGALPATGADGNSELYAVMGLGLLAAGGVVFALRRRRTRG